MYILVYFVCLLYFNVFVVFCWFACFAVLSVVLIVFGIIVCLLYWVYCYLIYFGGLLLFWRVWVFWWLFSGLVVIWYIRYFIFYFLFFWVLLFCYIWFWYFMILVYCDILLMFVVFSSVYWFCCNCIILGLFGLLFSGLVHFGFVVCWFVCFLVGLISVLVFSWCVRGWYKTGFWCLGLILGLRLGWWFVDCFALIVLLLICYLFGLFGCLINVMRLLVDFWLVFGWMFSGFSVCFGVLRVCL